MSTKIMPTHTCFDDALDTLVDMVQASPTQTDDLFLVHGLCRAPDGHLWAHAWVEWETGEAVQCVFAGVLDGQRSHFMGERTEYYAEICVVETTRYSVQGACEANRLSNNYGPWIERYRECCVERKALV